MHRMVEIAPKKMPIKRGRWQTLLLNKCESKIPHQIRSTVIIPTLHMENAYPMMRVDEIVYWKWGTYLYLSKPGVNYPLTSDEGFESKFGSKADKNENFITEP